MASVGELNERIRRELAPLYGGREAAAMARVIWEHLRGWQPVDVALHGADAAGEATEADIDGILRRATGGEPLQYILGEARFFGLTLGVDRSTLIPRPETEGLVQLVIDDAGERPDLRVLDVGTGSGAVALALARNLRFPHVRAIDISEAALEVARGNARRLKADVDFVRADIFRCDPAPDSLDIVVSNPPYVLENERAEMERNVLGYEPSSAIFAPDGDPVAFYRAIARVAVKALVHGGRLYFELNPLTAREVAETVSRAGMDNVELLRDIHGRMRYLKALKP